MDGLACEAAVLGKLTDVAAVDGGTVSEAAGMVSAEVSVDPEEDEVLGGTVFEAAEENRMLGSWSGGSGGTEEGSPVLRFFGPRGMGLVVVSPGCEVGSEAVASCAVAVVLLSFESDLTADEAAVLCAAAHEAAAGERFPVTRLRGPDETGRDAPLEERFMGPERGPRRGVAL